MSSHLAFVVSDNLYSIGGAWGPDRSNPRDVVYEEAFRTQLSGGGTPTDWMRLPAADLKISYASLAEDDNGHFFVTGGYDGGTVLKTTFCSTATQASTLTWQASQGGDGLGARFWHASAAISNTIYVIGGGLENDSGNFQFHTDTRFAKIETNDPCRISRWRPTTSSIGRIAGHAAVAFKGRIYVIGGFGEDYHPRGTVYFATPTLSGDITNWELAPVDPPLPPRAHHAVALVEEQRKIYVFGGLDKNLEPTDTVYSAVIDQNGNLSGWAPEDLLGFPDGLKLFRHSVVVPNNGSAYIIGGQPTPDTFTNTFYYIPSLAVTKSNDPSGPVHEGDIITYTISYANTGLITQNGVVLTDRIPFNTDLVPGSISPVSGVAENGVISWTIGSLDVGETGVVSFQVRVPLLPSLDLAASGCADCPPEYPPAKVLPVPIACDTTRFWAAGVTRQPPVPDPHTIEVTIPPGSSPSAMWLAVKGTDDISLTVNGAQVERIATSNGPIGASLWSAPITESAVASGKVRIVAHSPRRLNAIYLFDKNDPPFDEAALDDFRNTTKTFSYELAIPTVETQTMAVLMPFMDITYWTDDLLPDTRTTEVTVEFDDQKHSITANDPNLGNGLLMTELPFDIGPLSESEITTTKTVKVTVATEDDIYTLGPRICRPVRIENTAWLCSKEAGCISSTVVNAPPLPKIHDLYLPIILKP